VRKKDLCYVIGCGPIGLAVILMLKAAGVRTVVASDFSAARRELARRCGADVVVDPAQDSPWTAVTDPRYFTDVTKYFGAAFRAMRTLRAVDRLPWATVMRAAERAGATPRGPVVFECVGLPGVIEQVVTDAPLLSRIVVVGVCMEPDTFRPTMANAKELELRFSFAYSPAEFHETLQLLAKGAVDPRPLLTGTVDLAGVADAFEQLGSAEHHAKILVAP
jgi:threonine dehydrogenase-like Zn-dependent dehydrogenase